MNYALLPAYAALLAALILSINSARALNKGTLAKGRIQTRFVFLSILTGIGLFLTLIVTLGG